MYGEERKLKGDSNLLVRKTEKKELPFPFMWEIVEETFHP